MITKFKTKKEEEKSFKKPKKQHEINKLNIKPQNERRTKNKSN